jgi:6-phosphogluconolactonase (cycloisomerase 2 family)
MIASSFKTGAVSLSLILLFMLAGCGSTHVCNVSGTGCCMAGACPLRPGPEMLYATTSATNLNQILAMTIDANSGALGTATGVSGPANSVGLTAVNGQYLYASDTSGEQVFGYAIDQTNGSLTMLTGSPFTTGVPSSPAGLGAAPGTATGFLYAADGSQIDGFSVGLLTGLPSPVTGSPFQSGSNEWLAVDPFGKFLYSSAQGAPGGVLAFTIDSTGALSMVAGSPFRVPGQTASNSMPAGIVDTGTFVYAGLSATNQIAAFAIVSGTGALTPVPGSPFSAGANPDLLVIGRGNFLYALNASDHTISGYSINLTDGVLTQIAGSPFQISGGTMTTDPYGQYLYVTSAAGIQAFSIDATAGMLTQVSGSPFPASGAFYLTAVQVPPPFLQ